MLSKKVSKWEQVEKYDKLKKFYMIITDITPLHIIKTGVVNIRKINFMHFKISYFFHMIITGIQPLHFYQDCCRKYKES